MNIDQLVVKLKIVMEKGLNTDKDTTTFQEGIVAIIIEKN